MERLDASSGVAALNEFTSGLGGEKFKGNSIKIKNRNELCVDGRRLGGSVARANLELTERRGADTTPWQKRQIVEGRSSLA